MHPDSPGSHGSKPARPIKTFTRGAPHQIVGHLKGNVGGDGWLRTPDGADVWKFTDGELAVHCRVSKSTLQRYGKELWGHRRPMPERCGCALCRARVFNSYKVEGPDGQERWMLQYRFWVYNWIEEPKQPDLGALAALDRELAEVCEGYQAPREYHSTPFGIVPDNGAIYTELANKVLQFPAGQVVQDPPPHWRAVGGSKRQIDGSKRQSGGSLNKEVRHTESTQKNQREAAPQAAPSLRQDLGSMKLPDGWRREAEQRGLDADVLFSKVRAYYADEKLNRRRLNAIWKRWCETERKEAFREKETRPASRIGENKCPETPELPASIQQSRIRQTVQRNHPGPVSHEWNAQSIQRCVVFPDLATAENDYRAYAQEQGA